MKTTLDELLAFVSVVDSGSISAAAEHLTQTASGVSRALSRLEQKLEVTLLRRTTRRLQLTEEGQAFLAQARKILDAVESAEEQMKVRRQKPAGRLRVNAAAPFMLHVVVPLIAGFRAQYPQIQLELHSSDQIIDLLEQRTDVAIRIGALRDSTLHARPLGSNRLRILASPAYLEARGAPHSVEALRDHSLLGFTQPDSLNQWPLRHPLGDTLAISPDLSASSGETLRQLALADAGIVCLADFMTRADRARGELVQILAQHTVEVRQPIHAVYYRNTALASRITCFLDYLTGQLDGQAD
ncbi:LysR substrate-binding domain-containing protein [Pseudomonas sp. MMS21-TM103]|uniref:LysR substrate-binding domain-containing protein n=1 Tax=Pseudomonas sp. MMS21 TM103 TaxID=2886506 RepID=UPI001EDD2A3E|nr:LysR substrate-binding domain-containing protein [Pseudomonas sp. MMS21 TM103]MCG4454770.1 LysR substrate-binding domain-containing protein [Pseudomonas sp. MMS21 TM103]